MGERLFIWRNKKVRRAWSLSGGASFLECSQKLFYFQRMSSFNFCIFKEWAFSADPLAELALLYSDFSFQFLYFSFNLFVFLLYVQIFLETLGFSQEWAARLSCWGSRPRFRFLFCPFFLFFISKNFSLQFIGGPNLNLTEHGGY